MAAITVSSGSGYPCFLTDKMTTQQEIKANIANIVNSIQGNCPLLRSLGLPQETLSMITPTYQAKALTAVTEQIRKYEPRATVKEIDITCDEENPMKITVTVTCLIGEETV